MQQCCKVQQYQPEELITLPCVGWMHYNPSACTAHTHSCTGLHYLGVKHRVPLLVTERARDRIYVCMSSFRSWGPTKLRIVHPHYFPGNKFMLCLCILSKFSLLFKNIYIFLQKLLLTKQQLLLSS